MAARQSGAGGARGPSERRWIKLPDGSVIVMSTFTEMTGARLTLRTRCEALYREHRDEIVRAVYMRLHSWDESREVVQDAFVKVFRLSDPPLINHLRAYLYRTALNLAFDRREDRDLRSRGAGFIYTEVYSERVSENPTPERLCFAEEMRVLLKDAVDKLPHKTRMAFKLVEIDNLSVKEASEKMGVAEMAVYQLIHRSYEMMARAANAPAQRSRPRTGSPD